MSEAGAQPSLLTAAAAIEKQRIEQTSRYAGVACLIWVFMTGLLWSRGYVAGAVICCAQVFVMLLLMHWHRGRDDLRSHTRFTHLFLGFSCATVFLVAVFNSCLCEVLYLLPLGIFMASQVLGLRGAFALLLVNLAAFLAQSLIHHGVPWAWNAEVLDAFVLNYGIAFGTFLSCLQAETLYRSRTETLVALSEKLHHQATCDSLTGLKNRHQFRCDLDARLGQTASEPAGLALLMIDIDGFKGINDSLGHQAGDNVLREIATRLTMKSSNAYRLGGDEFCVIVDEEDPVRALATAVLIHKSLCDRYRIEGEELQLGASIGVAMHPEHASSASELLSFADAAMYHAKENCLGVYQYREELTAQQVELRKTKTRLATALERNEFFLAYQPQVDIHTGKTFGVEALMRWRCDDQIVGPETYIPLLESSQLIIPVGRWLIREACRQLRDWTDEGYDVRVSLNISVVQFRDPTFTECVNDAIDEFGVDATRLDFEVTEGVLIEGVDEVVDQLHKLKQKGSTISIDDFGTGYSSLAYLRTLPLDRLKIDREFIKDIPAKDDGTIASSVIVLAKSLGLKTVAEGIETEAQLAFLKQQDCDWYQGFYHSRPGLPSEVSRFFSRREGASPVEEPTVRLTEGAGHLEMSAALSGH